MTAEGTVGAPTCLSENRILHPLTPNKFNNNCDFNNNWDSIINIGAAFFNQIVIPNNTSICLKASKKKLSLFGL
jgi:hypothetical protein